MWKKRIRRSSSGAESPINTLVKNNQQMASRSPSTIVSTETSETNKLLETIVSQNAELKSSMLETITKVKTELTNEIRNQIESLVASFDKKINENNSRINEISERVATLERSCKISDPLDDCDLCIVIFGLPEQPNENVAEAVSTMLQSIDLRPNIVSAKRIPSRTARSGYRQNPGVIKIALTSLDEKVKILRAKRQLDTVGGSYRRVYMRSSETHAERLIKLNAQILLKELPNGDNFKVSGNGRSIHRHRDTEPRLRTYPVVYRQRSQLSNSVGQVNNHHQVSDNVFHTSSSHQNTYHKSSGATGQGPPPGTTGQGPPLGATSQGPPPGATAQGPARSNSASYNHGGARPRVSYQTSMVPNDRITYSHAHRDQSRQPLSKTDTRPSICVPDHLSTTPMNTGNAAQSMFTSSRFNDSPQQTRDNSPGSDMTGTNVQSTESTSSVLKAAHDTLFQA